MKLTHFKKVHVGIILSVTLMIIFAGSVLAVARGRGKGAEQSVTIEAAVTQRLVFSLTDGESVVLAADPIENPYAEARSSFQVKTNVSSYSIAANFGAFEVGDSDYDLIDNENFKVMSVAPDDGSAITGWTVPSDEVAVISGEGGLTNGETTYMKYLLNVDFSVPTGKANTTILFTATASM